MKFGAKGVPTCIDCHATDNSTHKILSQTNLDSSTAPANRAKIGANKDCHNTEFNVGSGSMHGKDEDTLIQRFTTWQVIQHALWALAFTTLLITGLALKFPGNFISQAVIGVLGLGLRATLHRLAALMFLGIGVVHIVYYLFIDNGAKPISE